MKLLGWMHRKFRQNSNEPLKDFVIGHACNCLSGQPLPDDQYHHQNLSCGSKVFKQSQVDHHPHHLRKSFAGLEAAAAGEELAPEDSSSAAASELFHGFLAIGTLGSDSGFTEPATPTFANSVENIAEKDTEVTENELKLINDELEKVLVAEAKEDWCNSSSSGRNSHVSNGRSSHGSTITLSGKPMEGQETSGRGSTNVCPLQEFLFGSAIEMSETTTEAKKEHRASLGELFQRSKTVEEYCGVKCEAEQDLQTEKEVDRSAMSLVKNKLKKKMTIQRGSHIITTAGLKTDPTSGETTFRKILNMFHKKVHPENSNTAKKSDKRRRNGAKNTLAMNGGRSSSGNQLPCDQGIVMYPQGGDLPREQWQRFGSQMRPGRSSTAEGEPNGSHECWIKTDADYLVLEL